MMGATRLGVLLGLLGIVGFSTHAHSLLMLELNAYAGGALVDTQTVSDSNNDGVVTYFGSIGSFGLEYTYGVSTSPVPYLGVFSVDATATGGLLEILLSDTGFYLDGGSPTYSSSISGFSSGYVTLASYVGGVYLGGIGPVTGIFDQTYTGAVDAAYVGSTFQYSQLVTINHNAGSGLSFFGAGGGISVPEPSTLSLFAVGLVGLSFFGLSIRRRASKARTDP